MNDKIFDKLEFDKIIYHLNELTVTDKGLENSQNIVVETQVDRVKFLQEQLDDAAKYLRVKGNLPLVKVSLLDNELSRLKLQGSLNGQEIAHILLILRMAQDIMTCFSAIEFFDEDYKQLNNIIKNVTIPSQLLKRLIESVDDGGEILDSASSNLRQIRKNYQKMEQRIRSQMDEYIHGSSAKYLSESIVTIRDDRFVLPVRQEYRGKFGGIVHDQSASGQTLFVEPQATLSLNNQLQEIRVSEKTEIKKILLELSQDLFAHYDDIVQIEWMIGQLDFLQAKALLAKELNATKPEINEQPIIDLKQARHPLIDQKRVVSNDIVLGKNYQMMLITGPNTGGKTITLKTVGIIQLMAQSGLFIPANEHSSVSVFNEIFADIGDEQSIEQNLSTFSSHISNIVSFMNKIDQRSLVLVDELGAGTDPEEGAALAISLLDFFMQKNANVLATTHYPELKVYGYDRNRVINASMEFDVKSLAPTYHLQIGIPGRSNAFNISSRLGIPESIINDAKNNLNVEDSNLNQMINKLNVQTKGATVARQRFESKLAEATKLVDNLEDGFNYFQRQVEVQIEKERQKYATKFERTQKQAEDVLADLRKRQLNGGQGSVVKENELSDAKGSLNTLHDEMLAKNRILRREKKKNQNIKIGDTVQVTNFGQSGVISAKIDNNQFEVMIGSMKVKVNKNNLQKIKADQSPKEKPKSTSTRGISNSSVKSTLDLRGQRYDEAMVNLDRYIDNVLLARLDTVTIIHGYGTGAIRTGVQDYLKRNKHVKSFQYASEGNGGMGATVVEL